MTEEIKILWEPSYSDKTKSHAYLDDENYEGLCGCQLLIASNGIEPPGEKKCKRCLKILARVMMVSNIEKQTSRPLCADEWPKNLRKSFSRLEMECPICYAEKKRRLARAVARSLKKQEAASAAPAAELAKLTPEELRAQADQDILDLWGPEKGGSG